MRRGPLVGLVGVIITGACCLWAASSRSLLEEEQARYGATHEVRFTHADLTTAAVDGVQKITNALIGLESKVAIEAVFFYLEAEFGDTNVVNCTNLTVAVGDLGSDVKFMPAQQISTNGPVWIAYGNSATQEVYTATNNLVFTFTPNGITNGLSGLDVGAARFFFRILDFR